MDPYRMHRNIWIVATFLMIGLMLTLVGGCAAKPQLLAKSATVPAGVDFTGTWRLSERSKRSVEQLEAVGAGHHGDILEEAKRARTGRRSRTTKGAAVRVFLETAENLKVTQTEYAMFVSFDRSVVEEFRFGENRIIHVGPITDQRVSGWEDGAYVVETLDDDGARLLVQYRLHDSGRTMLRQVRMFIKNREELNLEQVYERVR